MMIVSKICVVVSLLIDTTVIGFDVKKKIEGDMIQVDTHGISAVGVLLDEFPKSVQSSIVNSLSKRDDEFWISRVKKQIALVQYRLTFRSTFYPGKKQLMLPIESQWTIRLTSKPSLQVIDGHSVYTRNYTLRTYIIGKSGTARVSDPALAVVGGSVFENYTLPIDPQLVVQRTGFACMDENLFPHGSVDPESQDIYYDDSCTAGPPDIGNINTSCLVGCHCTKGSDLDCTAAVAAYVGSARISLLFTRVAWNENLASKIEASNTYKLRSGMKGADLVSVESGLEHSWIVYRYFGPNTCEVKECLRGTGWRRLLVFDTTDVNVGNSDLEIGIVNYTTNDPSSFHSETYHNLFYYDNCHHHPHFSAYANYTFGSTIGYKQGFCIQDVLRIVNSREVPITGTYDTCSWQGVTVGWADEYNGGIPCQWVDITEVKTHSSAVSDNLTVFSNPKQWLCEGTLNKYPNGSDIFVPTGQLTASPPYHVANESIDKWSCNYDAVALANDVDSVKVTVPINGHGLITSECINSGQTFGPKRDCEFALYSSLLTCSPGSNVALKCKNSGQTTEVVRICESSIELQSGTACRYGEEYTLANFVVPPTSSATDVRFKCPSARDPVEVGGMYSIYVGHIFNSGPITASDTHTVCVSIAQEIVL